MTFTIDVRPQDGLSLVAAPAVAAEPAFDTDVAVLGLGYVGLPTGLALHDAGCSVVGIDQSLRRLQDIMIGEVDLIPSDRARLASAQDDDRLSFTPDPARMSSARTVIVCVPTPVDERLLPDLEPLRRACAAVVAVVVPGQTLILTSTSYVGSTRDLLVEPLRARGLVAGRDVHVCFSPERIDPGNVTHPHRGVARVVGGVTPACTAAAAEVLGMAWDHLHPVSSPEAAEACKLVENTFRAVNIAYVNEVADACRALDLDTAEVLDAAATKPYGFMSFRPGPGVGGHCIPCDPHYLLWQLRGRSLPTPVIESAMAGIAARPGRVVHRVRELLSDHGRGLVGSRVLLLGVTYKPDVADLRESPALAVLDGLLAAGAEVGYSDPLVPGLVVAGRQLRALTDPAGFDPDLVVLHTLHSGTDLGALPARSLLLDTTYRIPLPPHGFRL